MYKNAVFHASDMHITEKNKLRYGKNQSNQRLATLDRHFIFR